MSLKDRPDATIPSWDGSSRTWRRYVKEIGWYVGSTKSSQRKYAASKLISRLTGSARLLAMSWSQREFDGEKGVSLLLQRLASSPLVRKSLPNAAAIMSEYFNFRRRAHESIGTFLVRETLGFEEFQEALLQLKEERDGIDPASRSFDLPDISKESDEDEQDWYWRQRWDWRRNAWQDQGPDGPDAPDDYQPVPQQSEPGSDRPEAGEEPAQQSPARGSPASPGRPSVHASPSRRSEARDVRPPEPAPVLNAMDSFILDVLRGWRLLVAASLSPEEWRDVLATTGNKLDYLSVSSALQTLWDEQLGGSGKWQPSVATAPLSSFWHESSWPYDEWSDNQAMWHDWNEAGDWPSEPWEAAATTEHTGPSDERVDDVTDPNLIEAMEAEKQAESLALEARRTWSQAQQATQQLRRDRGFGKSGGSSSSSNPVRCYLCGGPHLQKDCPDKHHPSFRKGYGKSLSQAELDAYLFGKSKGKSFKGKSKDGMYTWHDDDAWYYDSYMINKGKGKNLKGKYVKPSANVYGMDFYALEMMDFDDTPQHFHVFPLELFSTDETNSKRSTPPGYGMLDCGATASAGPEASAKRLISKLRQCDPDLKVCFNYNKRPYFRYGSGKWGQALYHAVIHSSWDSSRCFELYVLENPMEYNSEWFSDDMLVPILVGMDHLTKTGLILDFSDGHAVNGNDSPAVPYVMERNQKGHYMVNIAFYLFGTFSDSEAGGNEPFAAKLLEQDCHLEPTEGCEWYELAMVSGSDLHVAESSSNSHHALFDSFVQRRCQLNQSTNHVASEVQVSEVSPGDSSSHVSQAISAPGLLSRDRRGSEGHQISAHIMALFRQARAIQAQVQRLWPVEDVRDLCLPPQLCSQGGLPGKISSSGEPSRSGVGHVTDSTGLGTLGNASHQQPGRNDDRGHHQRGQDHGGGIQSQAPEGSAGHAEEHLCEPAAEGCQAANGFQAESKRCLALPERAGEEQADGDCQRASQGRDAAEGGSRAGIGASCGDEVRTKLVSADPISQQPVIEDATKTSDFSRAYEIDDEQFFEETYGNLELCETAQAMAAEIEFMTSPVNDTTPENPKKIAKKNRKCPKPNKKKFVHVVEESFYREGSVPSSSTRTSLSSPLPWRILKATLAFLGMMTMAAQTGLRDFLQGDRVDGWEMFCAPDSWLTAACRTEGLRFSRINLQQGYDLYKSSTYELLKEKYKSEKPKRIWVSTRCTYWCPFTSLNYQTVERRQVLEMRRRQERAMFRKLIPFLLYIIEDDPSVELFWEWPRRCYGWQEPMLLHLQERLRRLGKPWQFARIDGCRYGLRSASGGFLQKAWSIGTTSQHFFHVYKSKTCPGCHEHDRIQGLETQKSAYYPWKLCKSIAQTWRQELYPDKWLTYLQAPVPSFVEPGEQLQALGLMDGALDFCPAMDLCPGLDLYPAQASSSSEPSEKEQSLWRVQLMKYHRAAGHPNNYNLARILRDAGRAPWQVRAAMDLKCDECAALKLGGFSSGKIPPASMRPMPKAWECVGMDCTEWTPLQSQVKYYVLIIMDLATKFKVTRILMQCGLNEQKTETTEQVLEAFTQLWLQDKPKPLFLIPDNAMSMTSRKMREALSDFNITLDPPAPKESWAHGLLERANQEIKEVATKVKLNHPDLQASTCLALATHALNSTEYVQGYTPFQWVYGSQPTLTDEDIISLSYAPSDPPGLDYAALLKRRRDAEDVARKVKALRTLSKLNNSKVRQPLQVFQPMDLVKIWRKLSQQTGPRGGTKKGIRPQWMGPGRVVFHETINGQRPEDPRRHIVWVVIGGTMHRCSVHSVRKVTAQERLDFELHSGENPAAWKSLASFIPQRSFVDVVPEEPQEEDEDLPQLPDEPNQLPRLSQPTYRHTFKHAPKRVTFAEPPQQPEPVNAYDPSFTAPPEEEDEAIGNTGLGSGIPTLEERSGSSKAKLLESTDGQSSEPESKRLRVDDDEHLVSYLEQVDELYVLEFDMVLENDRQKRKLMDNPSLFLAQKMRDCEVRLEKLSPAHRELFRRAKLKEVNSFLANEAVRRCADQAEEQQARSSGRLMRCRWVLTWKPTPEESMPEALKEVQKKGDETTLTSDGRKKAKARIVLLGFEHPDLLSEGYKTSSPVQAVLTRNLSYQLVMQEGWEIEGLDLSTAFLQTLPTEESKQLWTTGVQELRQALGLPETGVLRILKDFYGSTTAPRNLWKNIDASLQSLGAQRIAGDPCFWLWRVPADPATLPPHDPKDAEAFRWKTLGFMAGHVDDFHRAGDLQDERWLKIRSSIDTMYKWGQLKKNEYRHAGTDLSMATDPTYGRCLVVDQSYYIEMLEDVQIDPQRFSMTSSPLTSKEISACRASIGALQWVAVQTQPLACARCNILLSELSDQPTMQLAQELQELIRELRKSSTVLKFFRLPKVHHWSQMYIVGLGDQAHQNRPKGGSTGGLLIFLSNRDLSIGRPAPMILVTWKTWKLKRVSIGTNDAEVQSLVEAEDVLFRTRLLWSEINSAGTVAHGTRADLLDVSEAAVRLVPGLLGTDSKGGYDSIMVNESPMLGLSNTRAAIQAYQLKEFLPRCLSKLLWLASDWNLADCMTKKKAECRKSMEYFFQRRVWMLKFDPSFVQSSRKEKATKGSPIQQMQGHHEKNSQDFCGDAVVSIHDRYSC